MKKIVLNIDSYVKEDFFFFFFKDKYIMKIFKDEREISFID